MRKSLLILLQIIMFAMPLFAERVDEKTAQKVAETFLKSKMPDKMDLKLVPIAYANRADFSNFYVFGGENCFVIVSADDCVKPILGYSDENSFGTDMMPENVYSWLKDYDNQIQIAVENKLTASENVRSEWQKLKEGKLPIVKSTVIVAPLIQTKWDQGSPYNSYCPKVGTTSTITGCVATAMAQVMKYWNYPSQGVGIHSYTWNGQTLSADFGATIYDWENMKNAYYRYYNGTNYVYVTTTSTEDAAVATLMYHCGVSVEMDYGTGSSGAFSSEVPVALIEHFRYSPSASFESRSSYSDEDWKALLKSELDEARPLYYSGNNPSSGHAFVCDGYRDDDYFHFNWGWSGSKDGYFLMDHLNPGSGGSGSGAGTYNLSNAIIAHLEPLSSISAPVVSSTAGQTSISITWNQIEGAENYDLYKDNVKIGTSLTETSFIDEDVEFGVRYQYYVRAIASNGVKSNPSNATVSFISWHDPVPTGLAANSSDNNVSLTWASPDQKSLEIYYGLNYGGVYYGYGGQYETYWGQKYPASSLSNYSGMEVNQVSFYAAFTGSYTLYLYKTNTSSSDNKLFEQQYTAQSIGWQNIILQRPVVLDCSKDLWVVFKAGTEITHPAACGDYNGNDVANARRISNSLASVTSGYVNANISWLINIQLSDGTFLFDVYRDDQMIAENISATQYTDEGLEDGTYDYYVKSVSNGHLSSASETVSATVLTHHEISSDVVMDEDLEVHQYNQFVVKENVKLTVNGNLVSTDPQYLILEDNAQLIHSNSGVQATVQKSITGYGSGNGNWYLVASPMASNVSAAPFATGEYDLYSYDEPTHYWMNSKDSNSGFNTLANGTGYLYANEADKQVVLSGELQPSNNHVDVPLSYTPFLNTLRGFNLVGNPFPCKAMLMGGNIAADFYVMNDDRDELEVSQNNIINPYEGIFVEATSPESVAQFYRWNPDYRGGESSASFDITVCEGRSEIDRARVRMGEGVGLGKFSLNDNSAKIYIPMDKQDYASVYVSGQNVLPLNFKPAKNGTYTLNFDLANVDLTYLHLIDNLTGADVDLMGAAASTSSASYSFDAKTTDYASRFKLVFAEKQQSDETDDSDFMYFADRQMFVFSAEENSIVQIVDATGRIVLNENVNGFVNKSLSLKQGVYVARMICGGAVKTQKFVAE